MATLSQDHLVMLRDGSGIADAVIQEREYATIDGTDGYVLLKQHGFSKTQARSYPGLLLPLWTTDGQQALMVYRPDSPRFDTRRNRPIKYELPKGASVRLDCPPRCQPMLADPSIPLWITEGQKKAGALASQGACVVAVLGIWNFKGTNPLGGTTLLADFDYIAWTGREVRLVFDSDVMTLPGARIALDRLTEHLRRKRAAVRAVYLPAEAGHKIGVDDYLVAGHTLQDLEALLDAPRPVPQPAPAVVELLDEAPAEIRRPLALVGSHAYAATWLHVRVTVSEKVAKDGSIVQLSSPEVTTEFRLFIVRDDGVVFGEGGDRPMRELGAEVHLPERPSQDQLWSKRGVEAYRKGQRPDPAAVFVRMVCCVDAFMDFKRSFAPQAVMCELVACYILATYFLEAWTVIGYLWPNGEKGSGKTNLLQTVAEVAYLGRVILAGGSFASLRDLADYGATLAFDDAEQIMDPKRGDPDKQALLLAGNRRGAEVPFKEPVNGREWRTRYVNTFCPRLFSAIRLPNDVLARRTIIIPLVRSIDPTRVNVDPTDPEAWPYERKVLRDDLWAIALHALPGMRTYEKQVAKQARLGGATLDPWKAILAVAYWLQTEHSVTDLFTRLEDLSVAYQGERGELETTDPTRLLILALRDRMQTASISALSAISAFEFETGDITETMNRLAQDEELTGAQDEFTNTRRVGRLLRRLRFEKATPGKTKRRWKTTIADVEGLAQAYGLPVLPSSPPPHSPQHAENAENAETQVNDSAFLHSERFRHFSGSMPHVDSEHVQQHTAEWEEAL